MYSKGSRLFEDEPVADSTINDRYMQSLDDAKNADEIDEKTFLFLRTHKVVLDSLMNITRGDYARFDSKTYLEVYEDIQSKSQKLYRDEAEAHKQTRQELEDVKEKASKEREENKETIEKLQERIETLEDNERKREKRNLEKRINICGWIITIEFSRDLRHCVSENSREEGLSNRATLEIMIDIKGNSFGCCLSLSKKSSKG